MLNNVKHAMSHNFLHKLILSPNLYSLIYYVLQEKLDFRYFNRYAIYQYVIASSGIF